MATTSEYSLSTVPFARVAVSSIISKTQTPTHDQHKTEKEREGKIGISELIVQLIALFESVAVRNRNVPFAGVEDDKSSEQKENKNSPH
jgi:hypothetical protein